MSLQQNLSNFMNTIRLSRNQSITEFAEEIGVSRSEMQHILKGTCNPRIDTLKYIAKNLDVDPATLILPSYTEPQQDFALLLLRTLDAFLELPEDQQENDVYLFHQLILLMKKR